MAQTVPILLTILTTVACFFIFGLFSAKSAVWKATKREATFWGADIFYSSPAQVSEKYPLNIYPAPWAISIIWPVVLLWNLSAMAYLLYRRSSKKRLFEIPTYLRYRQCYSRALLITSRLRHLNCDIRDAFALAKEKEREIHRFYWLLETEVFALWTAAWFLTTVWTFLFDGEVHLLTALCVLVVTVCSFRSFYRTAKVYELHLKLLSEESSTGKAKDHPYCYLVVDSLAILTTWSVCALAISVGYGVAYKHSRNHAEAVLTGILTPEESATIGAIMILCYFVLWLVLDLTYWIERSDCVRSIYPGFAIIMLFLGLSSFNKYESMALNTMLCFALSAASTIAFFVRRKAKVFFAARRYKKTMAIGIHKD